MRASNPAAVVAPVPEASSESSDDGEHGEVQVRPKAVSSATTVEAAAAKRPKSSAKKAAARPVSPQRSVKSSTKGGKKDDEDPYAQLSHDEAMLNVQKRLGGPLQGCFTDIWRARSWA